MATSYRSQHLANLRQNEEQMTRLFASLSATIAREIVRNADPDGTVPQSATFDIQRVAGEATMRLFVARGVPERNAPFTTLPDGTVMPLSPYMRILWPRITDGTHISVEQQNSIMRRKLGNAPLILSAFQTARVNPFAASRVAVEQIVFSPNPLAAYEPPHLWVDPRGHTLSERIWRTAGNTRRRLDMFIEERIAQGQGALDMARDLEIFLHPGRRLKRTNTPYGTNASFDAMRLARTEITRAAAQANEMAAELNPFITEMSVVLSPRHPCCDICDEAAAASPFPKGEIPAQYQIPLHPHCLCTYHYGLADNTSEILDELRDDVRRERAGLTSLIGPVQVALFTQLLLKGGLE